MSGEIAYVVTFIHHDTQTLVGVFTTKEYAEEGIHSFIEQFKQRRRQSIVEKLEAAKQQQPWSSSSSSYVSTMIEGYSDDLKEMDKGKYDYFQLLQDQRIRDKFTVTEVLLNTIVPLPTTRIVVQEENVREWWRE